MKDNKNHKPFNNYSKFQNKPLVASKGFNKHNKLEKPHFQPSMPIFLFEVQDSCYHLSCLFTVFPHFDLCCQSNPKVQLHD